MKKTTPYTTKTGLQIGSLYSPARPLYHCRDAEALQRGLLAASYRARTAKPRTGQGAGQWLIQRASALMRLMRLMRHRLQPITTTKETAHAL